MNAELATILKSIRDEAASENGSLVDATGRVVDEMNGNADIPTEKLERKAMLERKARHHAAAMLTDSDRPADQEDARAFLEDQLAELYDFHPSAKSAEFRRVLRLYYLNEKFGYRVTI